MKKIITTLLITLLFTGCATNDINSVIRAATSKDPASAFGLLAKNKSIYYAQNPDRLSKDIKSFKNFMNGISGEWGEDNVALPKQKEYVKYMQNYKSRAFVDFDKGMIRVETLDAKNPKSSLKNAIVTTLLLPDDPRGADLYSAKKVKLGSTPYLLGEVKDDQNKNIRYNWRASRYADILIKHSYKTKSIKSANGYKKVAFVEIPMVKDHADIRVAKYKPLVEKYAKKYGVSKNLIYAIIRTESNFNQFAVSHSGAFGLMQIIPTTAGRDAYQYVHGRKGTPSKSYLFNAENNIRFGTAYLNILDKRYLKGIYNPISREYCVICSYNTGSGNVLKAFSSNRTKAKQIINSKNPSQVYRSLRRNLKYDEPKRYLKKVVNYKKDFIRL